LLVEQAEHRGGRGLASLRLALSSGDWLPPELPDRLTALRPGMELISLGGATEASIWSIYYPVLTSMAGRRSVPYGRPLDNQTFHVLDDALQDRPDWATGQLYIGGIGLAREYWGDADKTAASFIHDPK
jgi:epothilone synthetase B